MDFGGVRDLRPLAEIPKLRGIELYQVRKLDTADLEPLGDCGQLEALSLGAAAVSLEVYGSAASYFVVGITTDKGTSWHWEYLVHGTPS